MTGHDIAVNAVAGGVEWSFQVKKGMEMMWNTLICSVYLAMNSLCFSLLQFFSSSMTGLSNGDIVSGSGDQSIGVWRNGQKVTTLQAKQARMGALWKVKAKSKHVYNHQPLVRFVTQRTWALKKPRRRYVTTLGGSLIVNTPKPIKVFTSGNHWLLGIQKTQLWLTMLMLTNIHRFFHAFGLTYKKDEK